MSKNGIIFVSISVIFVVILVFAIVVFYNNFKLTKELQSIKENIVKLEDINNDIDNELKGNEMLDKEEETNRNNEEDKKEAIKNTMIENIRKQTDKKVKEAVNMETIKGKDTITLEEATNNITGTLLNSLIVFLMGMEKISGYLALVFIIVGSIGAALSGKAPFVKKGFIGLIILGPVIFIISNYGPALLNLL